MIQDFGNACERATRSLKRLTFFSILGIFMMLWLFEVFAPHAKWEVPVPPAPRHNTASPAVLRLQRTNAPVAVVGGVSESSSDVECESNSAREVISRMVVAASHEIVNGSFPSADKTKTHYDRIIELLTRQGDCLKRQRHSLLSDGNSNRHPAQWFFDLGSRALDQTQIFLRTFPEAKDFNIVCFEANPHFNPLYAEFQQRHGDARLRHFNLAVGVENVSLVLSDANVGSSVIRDQPAIRQERRSGDVVVQVVDFVPLLLQLVLGPDLQLVHGAPKPHVVIKMDIEKMEFAVLHRMIATGAIALIDELLLECHYNTNLARSLRDPTRHLGMDDCVALVAALNGAFAGEEDRRFEAVLWNSKKTARSSGYSSRHGGFYPS